MKWNSRILCVRACASTRATRSQREDKKKETVVKGEGSVFSGPLSTVGCCSGDSCCDKRGAMMPSTCCLRSHLSLAGPVVSALLWSIITIIHFQQETMNSEWLSAVCVVGSVFSPRKWLHFSCPLSVCPDFINPVTLTFAILSFSLLISV